MNNPNGIRYIEEIPPTYRSVFQEYPCFNTVQSSVLDDALQTDNSLVVSAPTGSGKTAIFEMAIVRLLMLNEPTNIKMIYISPIKALCRERLIDWHKKFSNFGVKCISLTSDTNDGDVRNIANYNLLIVTPEKWDVITRRWRDNQKLVSAINLFMIDEVHLLNADSRGPTLEVIVSRMKTAEQFLRLNTEKPKIRFMALSATIPNVEDIAEWIEPDGTAKHFKFSEDSRPVKLEKVVYGFNFNKSSFKFDLSLNYKLPTLINKYSKGKPTLIFCSTRKGVEMTTSHLVANLQIRLTIEQKGVLNEISRQLTEPKLRQFFVHGIALHHAGLVPENRNIIESAFREGHLPILVATSTLAMGVNLPAHLVIVKGTKRYDHGEGFKDYDEVSIFQMIGRAGRSQFDTTATALILTSLQDKIKFEQMLNCTQQIESNLHKHLTEHLNAEVVLRTITDLEVAMNWLSSTFLYVRAKKCPEKYKLPAGLSKEKIDKKLLEICQIDLNKLVRAGMIKINEEIEIAPTVVGEIMAKYYIAFNTMELFTKISGNEIMIQILALLSKCHEFSEIHLRSNDKKCLNLLNKNAHKDSIRFPLAGKVKTVDMKINCIIQAVLGNLEITDQSILNDSVRVMRNCERLSNCLIEYLETRTNCYLALLNATILAKCFHVKLWENSPYVSKQLTGVGQVMSTLLSKAGKTSIKEISNTNPRNIELIVGRKAPFGSIIVDEVSHLPEYKMTLQKCNGDVSLVINLLNPSVVEEKPILNLFSKMTLLVGDSDNNILLYEKYAHSYMLDHNTVTKTINIDGLNVAFISANLISEDWVGIDCHSKLELLLNATDANKEATKNKQNNNNSKQTFMEMYMQSVKKGVTHKKKTDANKPKTISKKNTSTNSMANNVQNSKIAEPAKKTKSKEPKNKKIFTIEDGGIISESDINLANKIDTNVPKNDSNVCASATNNNNDLEPNDTVSPATCDTGQKLSGSNKKATNTKKKIIVANSIFRTKSKTKILGKPSKSNDTGNAGNRNQYNGSLKDTSKKINSSTYQEHKTIDEFKIDETIKDVVENRILDDDTNQMHNIATSYKGAFKELLLSEFEKENKTSSKKSKAKPNGSDVALADELCPDESETNLSRKKSKQQKPKNKKANDQCHQKSFTYKSQMNLSANNSQQQKNRMETTKQTDRTLSDEFFSCETQMNAVMDAFEHYENKYSKEDMLDFNKGSESSSDTDQLKHVSDKIRYKKLNTDKWDELETSSVSHKKVDTNPNGAVWSDLVNTDDMDFLQGLFPLCPEANPLADETDMKRRIPTKPLTQYPKKESQTYRHIFTMPPDRYSQSDTPRSVKNNENNTLSKNRNGGENIENLATNLQSFEKSKMLSEDLCDVTLYAKLYSKYNSQTRSNHDNGGGNYRKVKQKCPVEEKKDVEDNRDKDIMKATVDYPSTPHHEKFQRNFVTPCPKRNRGVEDYSPFLEGSQTKRIKWRSPLVHSPPEEFSSDAKARKTSFSFDFGDGCSSKEDTKDSNDLRSGIHDTSSSSTNLNLSRTQKLSTSQKLTFPICDRDYKPNKDDSVDCNVEYFGLATRQTVPRKIPPTKPLQPTASVGEYYSQLISSQTKSLRKYTEIEEKSEERGSVANYEPAHNCTMITPQKSPQSPISNAKFSDSNSMMHYSQLYQYPKPAEIITHSQNIPYEHYSQQCSRQVYNPDIPNEFRSNNPYSNFGNNINNYADEMDLGPQDVPVPDMPRFPVNDGSVHPSFHNFQQSRAGVPQASLGGYIINDGRYMVQSSPYFSQQQPYPDDMMYRRHEMFPPYPYRYPSTMAYGYPRHVDIDPYFKGPYPVIKVESGYPVDHMQNTDPKSAPPAYQSQIAGTVSDDYARYSQQSQQLDVKPDMRFENNTDQRSMNHFSPARSYARKMPCMRDNNNADVYFQANRHEQENCDPRLPQRTENNLSMCGQNGSRSTLFNNPNDPDARSAFTRHNNHAKSILHNSHKDVDVLNNPSPMFSLKPKRRLQHDAGLNPNQSQRCGLPNTPRQHLMMPSSSQKRLLNVSKFEDRLDNATLPRGGGFTLSTTRERQQDPRTNFGNSSVQFNDKEYAMNRFMYSNLK